MVALVVGAPVTVQTVPTLAELVHRPDLVAQIPPAVASQMALQASTLAVVLTLRAGLQETPQVPAVESQALNFAEASHRLGIGLGTLRKSWRTRYGHLVVPSQGARRVRFSAELIAAELNAGSPNGSRPPTGAQAGGAPARRFLLAQDERARRTR